MIFCLALDTNHSTPLLPYPPSHPIPLSSFTISFTRCLSVTYFFVYTNIYTSRYLSTLSLFLYLSVTLSLFSLSHSPSLYFFCLSLSISVSLPLSFVSLSLSHSPSPCFFCLSMSLSLFLFSLSLSLSLCFYLSLSLYFCSLTFLFADPTQINMLQDDYCNVLCQVDLKSKDVTDFKQAIKRQYHHNWIVDNLPAASIMDSDQFVTTQYVGFPVGYQGTDPKNYYLYNHVNIVLEYHTVETDGHRIVGFSVEPLSVKHTFATGMYVRPFSRILRLLQ